MSKGEQKTIAITEPSQYVSAVGRWPAAMLASPDISACVMYSPRKADSDFRFNKRHTTLINIPELSCTREKRRTAC